MILVDTSIWIDLLGKNKLYQLAPEQLLSVAICPPIIQEILQGIRMEKDYTIIKEGLLALPRFGDPIQLKFHLHAADIYRTGRRKGMTIRSSTDCLIAAIAIEYQIPIWHNDRDFSSIAKFTGLQVHHQ